MLTLLKGFFGNIFVGIWGYVAAAGAALVAVLAVYLSGKKSGVNEVVVKTKEKEVENVKKANEVERKVAATKSSVRREQLRKRWTRN